MCRKTNLLSTYSILGIDKNANRIGIATASCVIGVGGRVQFYRPKVGLVASQHLDSSELANAILDNMKSNHTLGTALTMALSDVHDTAPLQVAALDFDGCFASYSGEQCTRISKEVRSDDFMFIGNTLTDECASTVENILLNVSDSHSLSRKLLWLLAEFSSIGADKRGCESASILSIPYSISGWESQVVNLRIDNSKTAVEDLKALYGIFQRRFGEQ